MAIADTTATRAHPLTQADADWLVSQLFHACPGLECDYARMREAGLPNEIAESELKQLKELMLGMLRVYFPDRLA